MNRFSDEYARREVLWYSLKEYQKNGVQVYTSTLRGRQDELFNKRFWITDEHMDSPVFTIDGNLWMSITPLEVQSMLLPIERACDKVGTGGLGMGYFALKCAEKESVKEVKVWEKRADVIQFFIESFRHRKGFEKIKLINEDVRNMRDESFAYFFMDIYKTQLADEVMEDMDHFLKHNESGIYDFWCQEKLLLQALHLDLDPYLENDEAHLFMEFMDCKFPFKEDGKSLYKHKLYDPVHDEKFVEEVVRDYMGRL